MYASLQCHLHVHTNQCYQIVLNRVFKDMIVQKKGPVHSVTPDDGALSIREENVVHYNILCLDMLHSISQRSIGREQQILNCVASGSTSCMF